MSPIVSSIYEILAQLTENFPIKSNFCVMWCLQVIQYKATIQYNVNSLKCCGGALRSTISLDFL